MSRPTSGRVPGLVGGPLLAVATHFSLAGIVDSPARGVAALGILMATWWLTEAVPIPATALLPLAALPIVSGGGITIGEASRSYGHELIFLFMGGFMLALSMQRWGLHRRVALRTILLVGTRPRRVVLGFMLASAGLSMWISNTATTVMMLPVALSVIQLVRRTTGEEEGRPFPFAICLLLGIAYGASIGGLATIIGTPPNGLLRAFVLDSYGIDITMARWLPVGLSVTALMLPTAWVLLTRFIFPIQLEAIPGGRALIRDELAKLGSLSSAESRVLTIFALLAAAWMGSGLLTGIEIAGRAPLAGLSDAGLAMIAAIALFVLPAGETGRRPGPRGERLLSWEQASKLPWGVLLLFGGGLSLAAAVRQTGLDEAIGGSVSGLQGVATPVLVLTVTTIVVFLTEMTSNTATTATFLPIMAAVAEGLGVEPLLFLIPMSLAASCAFMMPVATPPNAIVFGSGEITIGQMCRAGLWLNLIGLVVLMAVTYLVAVPVFALTP